MLVNCPVCNTSYDLRPGKYKCKCGSEVIVNRSNVPVIFFQIGEIILNRYKVLDWFEYFGVIPPLWSKYLTSDLSAAGNNKNNHCAYVYKCFDEIDKIDVALKIIPPEKVPEACEKEALRARFQRVASLMHPNICAVKRIIYDSSNGYYYLIMEYVYGLNLHNWIKTNAGEIKINPAAIFPIIDQIADALDYAHSENIIHGSINPDNILICKNNQLKILNFYKTAEWHSHIFNLDRMCFELNNSASSATTQNQRYSMLDFDYLNRNSAYLAPEHWNNRPLCAETDQYALAAMTFKMLTTHVPFYNSKYIGLPEYELKKSVSAFNDLPNHVKLALNRGMSEKTTDRFPCCKAFAAAVCNSLDLSKNIFPRSDKIILKASSAFSAFFSRLFTKKKNG